MIQLQNHQELLSGNKRMKDYKKFLDETLKPKRKKYTAIDLFSGCGGLSLGFESVGFDVKGFEMDKDCCETSNMNLKGTTFNEKLNLKSNYGKCDVLIGGPPCQPFSVGGKQLGLKDSRDGFPIFLDAVKKTKPKLLLIENVRGLLYRNKNYLIEIIKELEKLQYNVEYKLINASHFYVPQNRFRLFIVGSKKEYYFPISKDLVVSSGEALKDLLKKNVKHPKILTKSQNDYIKRYEIASNCINPRDLHLDRPARTLTCRNLAGATADMMRIKISKGKRRRITTEEAARLQSFPSWFQFSGSETSIFNQIGNAVPPLLSHYIAGSFKDSIEDKLKLKNKGQLNLI